MTPEGAVKKAVLDLLAAERIPAWPMQTGAVKATYRGKQRLFRFGQKGMADVLAFPLSTTYISAGETRHTFAHYIPTWIEVKSPHGRQSPEQREFQQYVESLAMHYLIVRTVEDLLNWLKEHR